MLKLLAVDAHSSLVALGHTNLVPAALNLLTGVLGGVHVYENNKMLLLLFLLRSHCPLCDKYNSPWTKVLGCTVHINQGLMRV